jgi:hypothetical protein
VIFIETLFLEGMIEPVKMLAWLWHGPIPSHSDTVNYILMLIELIWKILEFVGFVGHSNNETKKLTRPYCCWKESFLGTQAGF